LFRESKTVKLYTEKRYGFGERKNETDLSWR
jgi:hypothetical protein